MSEVYNIFDIDNLVLEFSNSDLNASLITTDYDTEKGDRVGTARVGTARVVKIDRKLKNGLKVLGNTTNQTDNINLVWHTKDLLNHGYCRYTTQKNLAGTVVKFKISALENVVPYTDVLIPQYLTIIDNKNREYKVEFGKLGNIVSFDNKHTVEEEIKNGYVIPIEKHWICEDKSFSIKYFNAEDELKELLINIDFKVDYRRGLITFLKDGVVEVGTEIRIRGYHNSDEEYTVKFSTLRDINNEVVLVDDVKCVKFPIAVEGSIEKGNTFLYQLTNVEITRGGQSWLMPTELKQHDIELCENYTYTRSLNPRRLIYNVEKLGYKEKLILHLGNGEFFNLDYKQDITSPVFNYAFIEWYKDLTSYALYREFSEIEVVIPMYNKYLTSYCQQTYNGNTVKILNPVLDEVACYIKDIMNALVALTEDLSVKFIIEDLKWGMSDNGDLGIYHYKTVSSYITETGNDYLHGNGNVGEYEEDESTAEVFQWLSNKIIEFLIELTDIAEVGTIIDTKLLYSQSAYFSINNCFDRYLNYTSNVYISNSIWNTDVVDSDSLVNRLKDVFKTDKVEAFSFCIKGIDEDFLLGVDLTKRWEYITKCIEILKYELGFNILIMSGMSVRCNNYFLFNPLAYVELTTVTTNHEVALCKVNKELISNMADSKIESITRKVDEVDEIAIEVPYYIQNRFTHRREKNPCYDEVKTERLLRLNGNEYFVIKEITEGIGNTTSKTVRAYSLEHKLSKRPVIFTSGQSLQLYSDDPEQPDGILNYLELETGWKVGYINEECRFELVDGALRTKYRYFEEINTTWYSFLMENIRELFDCLLQFNTSNKTINVYPNVVLGADSGLYLTEDNYIKSIERTDTTNELVTRLTLIGRDEVDIYEVNPLGTDYVENFDYFIGNGEMSEELVDSLKQYYLIIEELFDKWIETNNEYLEKKNLQTIYESDIKILEAQIENWIKIRDEYIEQEDIENKEKAQEQIDLLTDEKNVLQNLLNTLNIEVPHLKEELLELSSKMDKETMTNTSGDILFTNELLSELQEFVYHDTYTDDSYVEAQSLMDCGIRVLKDKSIPTSEYKIDIVNFIDRVRYKRMWQGVIHLRDVVTLKSDKYDKEVDLFIVGFTYNPTDKTIELSLSNKITTKSSTKTIAELLKISKETSKIVNINKYLWAKAKEENEEIKNRGNR